MNPQASQGLTNILIDEMNPRAVTIIATTYQPDEGLSRRVVTTTPDNFTQTEDSYFDGRTASIYGDLAPAMVYSYTVTAIGPVTSQSY